ncbi:hypothetical protein [Methylocystis iwaonis]|nr:hypothetical protein [Methylocystis iwaonis]
MAPIVYPAVMPALVAGIHAAQRAEQRGASSQTISSRPGVDGRDKPGHDAWRVRS